MKRAGPGILKVIAGELLAFRPPEYFIFLENNSTLFVRVRDSGRTDVLLRRDGADCDQDTFTRFCEELVNHQSYFGQPITMLLNNDNNFSYVKRQGKLSVSQLYESVAVLPKDNLEFKQSLVRKDKGMLFVLQGTQKSYLEGMVEVARKCGLRITEIVPLETVLLTNGPVPETGQEAIYSYQLPSGDLEYAVFKANGDIVFGNARKDVQRSDETEFLDQLATAYKPWTGTRADRRFDCKLSTKASDRTGRILQSRLLQTGTLNALAHRVPDRKRAVTLKTVANSSRLLATTLLLVCLLLAAVTGVADIWAHSQSSPLEAFQGFYTRKITANRELDSLARLENVLVQRQGVRRNTAAIISSFCQRSFAGLSLGGITIDYATPGVQVEARGASSREATVFELRDHLAQQVGRSASVTVNSVRPQLRSTKNVADTSFEFSLSIAPNENNATK